MLDKLEYNEIIKLVSNYCKTYIGKVSVLNLKPCFDFEGVSRLLTETAEAMDISIRKSNIPICEIPNIDIWIKHLESNNVLSAKALIEIATVLKISRELKNYFFDDTSFSTNDFPILFDFFNSLYINKSVETTIFEKILDENTIADSASAKLSAIRRNRKKAEQDKAKLNAQRQQKNNEIGKLNSEEYTKSRTRMQELENEVGTYDLKAIKNALAKNEKLIAKCDLIGTNLVNGKSMEEITANLKNFKFKPDKNFSQKISTMRDLYKTEEKEKVEKTKKNNENATEEAKKAYEKARKAVETAEKARNEYEKISNLPAAKTPWYKKIPVLKQISNGISKIFNRKQTQNLEKTKKLAEETENAAKKAIEEYRTKKDEMEKTKKVAKDTEMGRSTEYLKELRGQKNEDEVLKGMAVYGDTFRDKLKYTVPNVKSSVTQGEVDKAKSKTKYVMNNKDPKNPDHTTDKRAYNVEARKAQVKANIEQIRKMKEEKSGSER